MMENTYSVYEGNMDALRIKMARIKNKCEKYGCNFSFEEVGEEFKEVKNGNESFVARFILVKAEGTASINGWEFISSVEHTEKGNIFFKSPFSNVEIPVKYRTTKCICEHCNSNRVRKNTCIVRNIETGEFKQVGNSCLKDFTKGMSAADACFFCFY